jgi:putative ABC transport system ATP-binding protein
VNVIDARDLVKHYRRGAEDVVALDRVSVGLPRGSVTALIGPSGSGKSTLVNILCGWEHADSGSVSLAPALDASDAASCPWQAMGIVPQSMALLPELDLAENISLPAHAVGHDATARVNELAEALGISAVANRLPHEASLGEQQRAAVARALLLDPAVLILDEPTSHLDDGSAAMVLRLVRAAASRGTACLIAGHDPAVVEVAHHVVALRDGNVADAAPE